MRMTQVVQNTATDEDGFDGTETDDDKGPPSTHEHERTGLTEKQRLDEFSKIVESAIQELHEKGLLSKELLSSVVLRIRSNSTLLGTSESRNRIHNTFGRLPNDHMKQNVVFLTRADRVAMFVHNTTQHLINTPRLGKKANRIIEELVRGYEQQLPQ